MSVSTNVPDAGTPIFDARGFINPVWHQFFFDLLRRTGGAVGVDAQDQAAAIQANAKRVRDTEAMDSASVQTFLLADDPEPVLAITHGVHSDPILHDPVTQLVNGFMLAADKIRLDALRNTLAPATIIASVPANNTTADIAVNQIVAPAGSLPVGSAIRVRCYVLVVAAAVAQTLSFWIKIGATKLIINTVTPPGAGMASTGLRIDMSMTVRAGTLGLFTSEVISQGNLVTPINSITTGAAAFDPSISNTIVFGMNWSVANAGNTASAQSCVIVQEN